MKLLMTNFCPYMVCVPNFMQNNHFPGIMEGDYAPSVGSPYIKGPSLALCVKKSPKWKWFYASEPFGFTVPYKFSISLTYVFANGH